ncbi:MAG: class I SAM-dependent methyltransferase [Candidatus Nealsonbacteria bacterium]|nr:class I SAM-dependent methyltransferase [Candidatus Nealsonbacteria bacterium]
MSSSKNTKVITACRSCFSKQLIPIFSLGKLCISNFIDLPRAREIKMPLELVLCKSCWLLQLKHTISQEQLYRNYWYRSGVNKTMREELAGISSRAPKLVDLNRGDFVLDIGSNDSTLLLSYKRKGLRLVGFEPARNLMSLARAKGADIINDFFNYEAWRKKFGKAKAKIITAIAMFYDLDNPNKFVADARKCLDEKGVFIIQMSYLPSMLQQNDFSNICHEHLEYYSLTSLKNLLYRHGLEVFDAELNDINGGSFRIYIQHKGCRPISNRVRKLEEFEKGLGLSSKKPYKEFISRILAERERLNSFIKSEAERGKDVYVYGASTKGNTILQFCNLKYPLIKAAADRNPMKWGKKTVATLIPIISEEQARKERPDYFLVLPWHFLKEFITREKKYLESGGKFIIPLPNFKIISREDL